MKRITFTFVLGLAAFSSAMLGSVTQAQHPQTQYSSEYQPAASSQIAPVQIYYPFSFPSTYRNHASTSDQGVLMGLADLYRGAGEYEVANSVAAYNWQLARAAALQNNIVERAARAQVYRHSALTQELKHRENAKKNQAIAERQSRERQMAVASSGAFNKPYGDVRWPLVIYENRFTPARREFEEALRQKPTSATAAAKIEERLVKSIEKIELQLEADQNDFRSSDYDAARGFVAKMKAELSGEGVNLAANY